MARRDGPLTKARMPEARPLVFISHSTDDAPLAGPIKDFLESLFLGVDVFISSRDLNGGQVSMKALHEQLVAARAIVAFVTPSSADNRWILFEAGVGFVDEKTIPLCAEGMTIDDLAASLRLLQARTVDPKGLKLLAGDVARLLSQRAPLEFPTLEATLRSIEEAARSRAPAEAPESDPPYDPELLQKVRDLDVGVRTACIEAILEGRKPDRPIPTVEELEKKTAMDLQSIADAYGIPVPEQAVQSLFLAGATLPRADHPEWKKINARKNLDQIERLLRGYVDAQKARRKRGL